VFFRIRMPVWTLPLGWRLLFRHMTTPFEGPSPGFVDDPDVALMQDVVAGSETSFAALIRRYQGELLNFFIRMGAYMDGDDLVQETFLRVYRYRDRYRPRARFRTFLYVIARHVWVDRCRKLMRRDRLSRWLRADVEIGERAPADQVPATALDVQAMLDRLTPKLKEVLVMNVYQGLRYQEIADILHLPVGTVKSRINLALNAIRSHLEP